MDKEHLRELLSSRFNEQKWRGVLSTVFGARQLLGEPVSVTSRLQGPYAAKIDQALDLGRLHTADGKELGLYHLVVQPATHLEQNRAGLRNLLNGLIQQGLDGALVVFEQGGLWRLSLIAETLSLTPQGTIDRQRTPPRRFTYLLGEGRHVRTATDRLAALPQRPGLDHLLNAFSVETLTKDFYRELSDWYFWALGEIEFPADAEPDREKRHATALIRLITRMMFVWFLKEKGLVSPALFDKTELDQVLNYSDSTGSTYYKAILQNLFFATLNTRIGDENRRFINRQTGVQTFYRYERFFKDVNRFFELTRNIPFLNGGLFECLDKVDPKKGIDIRVDCFSERVANEGRLKVPDSLFFSDSVNADLSRVYDDQKKKQTRVRGLLPILKSYNFTLEENTPLDQEVALDPEMLGKVFENLLAAFNPETQLTARKQTGSFYTPREIVDYMVDECLMAYLKNALRQATPQKVFGSDQLDMFGNAVRKQQTLLNTVAEPETDFALTEKLKKLFAYHDEQPFDRETAARIVTALDNLTLLDPACGSGAFPMGVLQKMVHILEKLDPNNERWRKQQEEKARRELQKDLDQTSRIRDEAAREAAERELQDRLQQIEVAFDPRGNDLNYARKLFLIQNCIYGTDIQPIAVQIAKLRFFISLMVDQKVNEEQENRGILSLPNLETKFVAADAIEKIPRPSQLALRNEAVMQLEKQLADVRNRHFSARTTATKQKYRDQDETLRGNLETALISEGWGDKAARLISSWNPYDQNASAAFFDSEWMFGPRLAEGFHIIIGNPPYVQLQKLGEQSVRYQKLGYKTFVKTGDLYCLFFERGMETLRPGGVLCFIASNKWMRAGYGKTFRAWLNHVPVKGKQTGNPVHLDQIVDFGDLPVFEATAYPAIVLLKKDRPAATFRAAEPRALPDRDLAAHLRFFDTDLTLLDNESGWSLAPASDQRLLQKIRKAGVPLGEYVNGRIYYGIKTGLNEAFVIDEDTRAKLVAEDPRSAEVIKPFLAGRDIKRYKVNWRGTYLIFTRRGIEIERYPVILNYLSQFREQLEPRPTDWKGEWPGRKPGSYKWYELQDAIDYYEAFEGEKIIVPAIVMRASYALDQNGFLSNDKTTIIPGGDRYLLGVINSEPCDFFMHSMAPSRANGYFEYKPVNLVQLPIPDAPPSAKELIAFLVENILRLSESDVSEDRVGQAYLEQVIDACVYELYFPESVAASGKQVLSHLAGALQSVPREVTPDTARSVWKSLYPPEHPVRKAVYYMDTVPEVRRIQQILKGHAD
jgi:hypothetical protein